MKAVEQLLPIILIGAAFWFLLIRPQRRRQQALAKTQRQAEIGAEVMLGSGIVGRVASEGDEFVQLEIAPGVEVKVVRAAIVRVLSDDDAHTDTGDAEVDPSDDLPESPSDDSAAK